MGQFDAAKESYESLRTFGDNATADSCLKKLDDAQERDAYCIAESIILRLKSIHLYYIDYIGYDIDLFDKHQNASKMKYPEKK